PGRAAPVLRPRIYPFPLPVAPPAPQGVAAHANLAAGLLIRPSRGILRRRRYRRREDEEPRNQAEPRRPSNRTSHATPPTCRFGTQLSVLCLLVWSNPPYASMTRGQKSRVSALRGIGVPGPQALSEPQIANVVPVRRAGERRDR